MGVSNLASLALEKARLHEDLIQRERVQRDLALADQVQRSFLPQRLPEVPGYQFYAQYKSALTIGGDYYDFVPLPGDRLGVLLGDVAGKGVPAALLMAKLGADVNYAFLLESTAEGAMSRLNDRLLRGASANPDRFITLLVAVLDPRSHCLEVVNAGHVPALLRRAADGSVEVAGGGDAVGMPLMVLEGAEYQSCRLELAPGDALVLYTDGVTDAMSTRNEPFTLQGIYRAVRDGAAAQPGPCRPDHLGKLVIDAVRRHAAGRAQNDDIALVCFGRLEPGEGIEPTANDGPTPQVHP
jgi:serine phosphatase RsbU (regulator of sigma subunit)